MTRTRSSGWCTNLRRSRRSMRLRPIRHPWPGVPRAEGARRSSCDPRGCNDAFTGQRFASAFPAESRCGEIIELEFRPVTCWIFKLPEPGRQHRRIRKTTRNKLGPNSSCRSSASFFEGLCGCNIVERAELLLSKDHGVTRQFRRIDPIRSSQVHFARTSSRNRAIPAPSAWLGVWQRRYALAICDRAGASQLWAHRQAGPKSVRKRRGRPGVAPRRREFCRNLPDINRL